MRNMILPCSTLKQQLQLQHMAPLRVIGTCMRHHQVLLPLVGQLPARWASKRVQQVLLNPLDSPRGTGSWPTAAEAGSRPPGLILQAGSMSLGSIRAQSNSQKLNPGRGM